MNTQRTQLRRSSDADRAPEAAAQMANAVREMAGRGWQAHVLRVPGLTLNETRLLMVIVVFGSAPFQHDRQVWTGPKRGYATARERLIRRGLIVRSSTFGEDRLDLSIPALKALVAIKHN